MLQMREVVMLMRGAQWVIRAQSLANLYNLLQIGIQVLQRMTTREWMEVKMKVSVAINRM